MAETFTTLLARKSCRAYTPEPVPQADLERIVEAGTWAPTGRGMQAPYIIAVTNQAVRDELSRMNAAVWGRELDPFYGAPAALVVVAATAAPTYVCDGACVMENLQLAATDLGYGSCWINRAQEMFATPRGKELLQEWGIEEPVEGIGICVVGHAAAPAGDGQKSAGRKPRKEGYVHWVN